MKRASLALKLMFINYGLPDDASITLKHLAEKTVESTNIAVPTVLYLKFISL
jgi:hypothetical protein